MSAEPVILLPGIWFPPGEMRLLKRRLEHDGRYDCHLFGYPSVRGDLDENARRLYDFAARFRDSGVHLVGHSLGGVVALRMLANHADAPSGRLVCLGSPLAGCRAAERLGRFRWGRSLAGHSLRDGVVARPASAWAGEAVSRRDVGIIAGTVPVGLGRLVASFDGEHDGTVAVEETRMPGARDHLCMPLNHTALVLSADAAAQVEAFLRRGEFLRDDAAA